MSAEREFDVAWREGALGVRFTPNERDEPVVCQVPAGCNAAVLASPAAVGDVLLGFRPSSPPDAPMRPLTSFDQLLTVLARAPRPLTLRFRSRANDAPERVLSADARRRYEFEWAPGAPLGVSLAMDPCSLHAAITSVDPSKLAPALRELRPELGDVLVAVSGAGRALALDTMRFEDVIQTLRTFPRPCRLAFARAQVGGGEDDDDARERAPSHGAGGDARRPTLTKQPNQQLPGLQPPSSRPPRRPLMPLWQRQSFKIDGPAEAAAAPASAPTGAAQHEAGEEPSPFYTVEYGGGAIGLHLRDCSQDDRRNSATDRSNRTNGYSVAIREVTDARSAAGLERASAGDLLMAIGSRDLQHLGFDKVRAELARVSSPTRLLFKKRKAVSSGSSATSSSLVDALLLFLV